VEPLHSDGDQISNAGSDAENAYCCNNVALPQINVIKERKTPAFLFKDISKKPKELNSGSNKLSSLLKKKFEQDLQSTKLRLADEDKIIHEHSRTSRLACQASDNASLKA